MGGPEPPLKIRVRLAAGGSEAGLAGEYLAQAGALDAAGVDSILVGGDDAASLLAAVAAVTYRARLAGEFQSRPAAATRATLEWLAGGRLDLDSGSEAWHEVEVPQGRAAWRESLDAAREAGATGVVVAYDPRLIDILRNPLEDDRQDLQVAQG